MLNTQTLKEIEQEAIHQDWDIAFNGKSKGNRHLYRVNKIAHYLAEKEFADINITLASAWIHDVGLIAGNDDSPEKIKSIVTDILSKFDLTPEEIETIATNAASHEGDAAALSLEAKIVHDADVLDKAGMLGVIRHTWKIVNMINPDATNDEIYATVKQHLKYRENKLYTQTAQNLIKVLNQKLNDFFQNEKLAKDCIQEISALARQGLISDKIAEQLVEKHQDSFIDFVKQQLTCSYL